ncbi:MAG: tetratricopeptide repeat protein, partial [Gammaproteobacteria bacterium]|nr:tetratricopeptide repeat protein [Gammaproteobacteria bacterium]
QGEKTRIWRDEGYWLLLPLLLLGAFAFRRGGALAAILLCALLPWQPAYAADNTWWRRPDQQAYARELAAAEAYRGKDYDRAAQTWREVPGVDADYNRGNALAKTGRYEDAIAAYDEALRQQPGMADAIANRNAVLAAMKRKPPPGPKQGNRSKQDQQRDGQGTPQDEQDGSGKTGQQPQSSQQQANDGQGRQGPRQPQPAQPAKNRQNQGQQPAPQPPADAQAQRAADAAQRQRIQEALRKAQQAQSGAQSQARPERVETAEQRERRLANEAWLRRVPDDPGGLLRAKFRLEHERRQLRGDD